MYKSNVNGSEISLSLIKKKNALLTINRAFSYTKKCMGFFPNIEDGSFRTSLEGVIQQPFIRRVYGEAPLPVPKPLTLLHTFGIFDRSPSIHPQFKNATPFTCLEHSDCVGDKHRCFQLEREN